MNAKMTRYSRIVSLITALSLIGVIFLPLWTIELTAPQYPEGLALKIYSNKLSGNVDVVNGLNHYIGMRTLHEKDFPEFLVLPYIIGTLVFFGLLSFAVNRRWFFLAWVAFYMIFSFTAMIDFYRWEYDYGHNLDPTAPIQVPGMSYQPPLIGFKQLLNFGVFSYPDSGGLIFIGVALLLFSCLFMEWKAFKRSLAPKTAALFLIVVSLLSTGCESGPKPINLGKENCFFCKMTITDGHYGGEVVMQKGKVYFFDDSGCLLSFLHSRDISREMVKEYYLMDYSRPNQLVAASTGYFLKSEALNGPMGGDIVAFADKDSLHKFASQFKGQELRWPDILN